MNAGVVAGLLLGGPRILAGQQVVLGHRPPPGRALQERGLAALAAQPRPQEVHLELHPLRAGNTVGTLCLLVVDPALTGWLQWLLECDIRCL